MVKHPFNEGTKLAKIFMILCDGDWHCGKHELPGTQPAKAIQIIRQHGFQIENKTQYCSACKDKTVHRRLVSTEPIKPSYARLQLPPRLRERILRQYKNTEAITMRQMLLSQLEVDHRFPQVRWVKDEIYDPNMPEEEIRKKFQLFTPLESPAIYSGVKYKIPLVSKSKGVNPVVQGDKVTRGLKPRVTFLTEFTREHNLWKSRYCERCFKTNERGTFIGINYFYQGNEYWDKNIGSDNEKGCIGCFWFDPDEWRKSLNKHLKNLKFYNKAS